MKQAWFCVGIIICGAMFASESSAQRATNVNTFNERFARQSSRFQQHFWSQSRRFQERLGIRDTLSMRPTQHRRDGSVKHERKPRVYSNDSHTLSKQRERSASRSHGLQEKILPLEKVATKPELSKLVVELASKLEIIDAKIEKAKRNNNKKALKLAEREKEMVMLQLEFISIQVEMLDIEDQ